MIFITAFLTGLLGSFHCVGMCGPISLATPNIGKSVWEKLFAKILYNLGRIFTYASLGFLLGSFGMGLKLAGLQQSISIGAGIVIILGVLLSSKWLNSFTGNPFSIIKGQSIAKLFQKKSYAALFLIGLLNGLLPCGFVYIALVGSVATQEAFEGALFMALFGLGTFPLMLGVSMLGQFLSLDIRRRINKLTPVFAIVIGCVFILRGMNLGIPYLSPKLQQEQGTVEVCHEPANTN
jgi:sulfite exporter TauE/SafE